MGCLSKSLWILTLSASIRRVNSACLKSGDYTTFNYYLSEGGPGTILSLCPNRVFYLTGTIIFTAKNQEISTEGYPDDKTRAKLIINSDQVGTAIQGDCRRCAYVKIRNIVIDGSREAFGRSPYVEPLIALGNNEGQVVERCKLSNARGSAGIHVREGDGLSCTGARIENNEIGPLGEEWIESVDGPIPDLSPIGPPLGDGITLACRSSLVKNNFIVDTTDIGIVVFGSPESIISHNHISSMTRTMIGGIFLVSEIPYDGNYSSVVVHSNYIHSSGSLGYIRVAIGLGAPVWSDDFESILFNGTIKGNTISGDRIGYGIVAAGLQGFVVEDNISTAHFTGSFSARCPTKPQNAGPTAFLLNSKSVSGEFQDGFVNGEVQFVVCIVPLGESPITPHVKKTEEEYEYISKGEPEEHAENSGLSENAGDENNSKPLLEVVLMHAETRTLQAIKNIALMLRRDQSNNGLGKEQEQNLNQASDGNILHTLEELSSRLRDLELENAYLHSVISTTRLFAQQSKSLTKDTMIKMVDRSSDFSLYSYGGFLTTVITIQLLIWLLFMKRVMRSPKYGRTIQE